MIYHVWGPLQYYKRLLLALGQIRVVFIVPLLVLHRWSQLSLDLADFSKAGRCVCPSHLGHFRKLFSLRNDWLEQLCHFLESRLFKCLEIASLNFPLWLGGFLIVGHLTLSFLHSLVDHAELFVLFAGLE